MTIVRSKLDLNNLPKPSQEDLDRYDAITGEPIDYSDIPELDEVFWQNAVSPEPDRTEQVTLRVKKSVLDSFKSGGRGYQTRMNAVLESYVRATQKQPEG